MDVSNVSSMAAYVTAQQQQRLETNVSIEVLKSSMEMQEQVMQLTAEMMQALGNLGTNIDVVA